MARGLPELQASCKGQACQALGCISRVCIEKALHRFVKHCVQLNGYDKELSGEIEVPLSIANCQLHNGWAG